MEANKLQGFIGARAAAPLHIRETFCTAPSDWFCRIHWVWRMQRPFYAPATGQRGTSNKRKLSPICYQYNQSGAVRPSIRRIFAFCDSLRRAQEGDDIIRRCTCRQLLRIRDEQKALVCNKTCFNVCFGNLGAHFDVIQSYNNLTH